MNAIDFAPLFRSAIGFDRLARQVDSARAAAANAGYPPYNIERAGDDSYTLTMAVAGFSEADLDITTQENVLVVTGRAEREEDESRFLYRGISGRPFERRFVLADHIEVEGAQLQNGLLHVALRRRVPEALKPRKIAISTTPSRTVEVLPSAA
ncbi:Hsp20 family protein [Acetobacteraceae bacterium H6797]|nr:Hsp20 family protein [Acetobacteraceae bacterium H6797]